MGIILEHRPIFLDRIFQKAQEHNMLYIIRIKIIENNYIIYIILYLLR